MKNVTTNKKMIEDEKVIYYLTIRHRVALHRHAVSRMGVGTDGRSQIETLPDIIILNTQIFISHSVFPVNL